MTAKTRCFVLALTLLSAVLVVGCKPSPSASPGHFYSTVIHVALSQWQAGTNTAGQKGFVIDLPVPEIDDAVMNRGGVAVYYKFEGSSRYEPLPLVFNGVIYHAYHSKGVLSLRMFSANGSDLGARPPPEVTGFDAKIVLF